MSTSIAPIDGPDEAERELAELQAHENAAKHRLLALIRYIDNDGLWHRQGGASCAHWLAWRLDIDPGAARERVRVARALGGLPEIDDALRRARLSLRVPLEEIPHHDPDVRPPYWVSAVFSCWFPGWIAYGSSAPAISPAQCSIA